jgi:S-disulfanyl-L-cysteine oxidoreductase SoxD
MMLRTVVPSAFFATVVVLAAAAGAPRASHRLGAQPISASVIEARVRPSFVARDRWVVADSVPMYTEEQATAGLEVFTKVCSECHEKKDMTSADFKTKWGGRPLGELYELVRTTMPDGNPGSLSRTDYANALAYVLKLNGLPAGAAAVMPDSAAMSGAKVVFPAAGG